VSELSRAIGALALRANGRGSLPYPYEVPLLPPDQLAKRLPRGRQGVLPEARPEVLDLGLQV